MATALREHPDDIKQSVHAVKTFLAARLAVKCHSCRSNITDNFCVRDWMRRWPEGAQDWCCGDGRLFGIWLLLARYDRVEIRWQASSSTTENTYTLARDKNGESSRKTQDSRGIGPLRFRGSDEREDEFVGKVFDFVGRMIPGPANKNLPSELHAMLQLGLLLDKVADLLRNDSLDNVTKRRHVYKAAFGLVAKLGSHPDLIDLVKGARYHKQQTPGLKPLSSSKPLHESPPLVLGEKIETASSTKHYCP
ncbi:putative E2 ubiquitin-conjugating enzyme [Microsporum canis]